MKERGVLISTITNIAYGLVGVGMWFLVGFLSGPAFFSMVLMAGSGYHHYHLKEWSKKYDYIAMYLVLSSLILFGLQVTGFGNFMTSTLTAVIIYLMYGSSRVAIGILIGLLLVVLVIVSNVLWTIAAIVLGAIAFAGNRLGDTALKDHHDFVHGVWWHVVSAASLLVAFAGLAYSLGYFSFEGILY